jgi:hypothetical protein
VVAPWPPEEYTQSAAAVGARFEQAAGGLERHEWHDANRGGDAELLRQIVDCARYGDLMILGQHDESSHAFVPPELPETVVTGAHRPVLIVPNSNTRYEEAKAAGVRVEQHLACHGVADRSSYLIVDEVGVMDSLLNQVSDEGADLLVMGAHGHVGLPSLSRGAGTRQNLRHMTVPVLTAA